MCQCVPSPSPTPLHLPIIDSLLFLCVGVLTLTFHEIQMPEGQRFLSEYMPLDNRNLTNSRVLEGVHDFIGMNQRVIGKE